MSVQIELAASEARAATRVGRGTWMKTSGTMANDAVTTSTSINAGIGQGQQGFEEKGVLSYLEIRTGASQGRRIQSQLTKLIKSLEEDKSRGGKRYRLTLAFYPLEPD